MGWESLFLYKKISRNGEKITCADDMKEKMKKAIQNFVNSLVGIRMGTVSCAVIDTVKVDYNGQLTPIKHLAQTGKIQNSIFVEPYDLSIVGKMANTLKENGFTAYVFSKTRIIVIVPPICGEEKERIKKHLAKLAEEARVSVRNIRKNTRQKLSKELIKEKEKEIQSITDDFISEIDTILDRRVKSL